MTTEPEPQFHPDNPARLVWFIIILGCCAGFVLSSIVWWTSVDVRHKREKLDLLADKLIAARNDIGQESTRIRWQYASLFSLEDENTVEPDLDVQPLSAMVDSYQDLADFANITPFFVDLKNHIQVLHQHEYRCRTWAKRQTENKNKLPQASQQITKALAALTESLEQAHGRRRLSLVLEYRKFRDTPTLDDINIARHIADEGIRDSGLFGLKPEVADLALLVEQLRGETRSDHLIDLKDNRLRTIMVRLRREVALLPAEEDSFGQIFLAHLTEFELALLGQDYSFENDHQTIKISMDGFYSLMVEHLRLADEREILRATMFTAFEQIQEQLRKTGAEVNKAMQLKADLKENPLQRAWQIMLGVSFLMAAIFLAASAPILKTIRTQVKKIQDANEALSFQARELMENEEVLREKQAQLEYLSSSLLTAQEDERQRVAYELHDELGQSMTALKLQVRSVVKSMGDDASPQVQEKCTGLYQSITKIIESVRQLSRDLSPAILKDLGIEAALVHLLTTFQELHDVVVERDLGPINLVTNLNTQRNIYRIVQELLTNISKHANAHTIVVTVHKRETELVVTVSDDGCGFDVARTSEAKNDQRGMGLSTIAERVRIMGGILEIQSEQGRGVQALFTIPLS